MGRNWDEWQASRARNRSHRRGSQQRSGSRSGRWCDAADLGCEGCDILDLGCNLFLLHNLIAVVIGACRASAVDPHTHPRGPGAQLASRLVRSYQLNISARRAHPVCNLSPSCSRYGLQVLAEHGAARGARLIRARLRECGRLGRARRDAGGSAGQESLA